MKVLAINGSHRRGSTLKLLEIALGEIDGVEKEIVSLSDYEIDYCRLCGRCKENGGRCIIEDGFNIIAEKMKEADVIVVGSPVYFGSVTGKLKSLFDRSRALRVNWDLKDKLCAAISVGGNFHGGQEHTIQAIHAWALIHAMIVVGDSNPTAHFGGVAVNRDRDGEFDIDERGIKTAKSVGKRIKELISLFKGGES
jgi:multimeric flavodoxin WrbA